MSSQTRIPGWSIYLGKALAHSFSGLSKSVMKKIELSQQSISTLQ